MSGERILRGVGGSPGAAVAPVVIAAAPSADVARGPVGSPAEETARLSAAVEAAVRELEDVAARVATDGHGDEAAIFEAQALMAADPMLLDAAGEHVRAGVGAAEAIERAAAQLADQLRGLGNELLAARAADVIDVGDRIAGRLDGRTGVAGPRLDAPSIVAAEDLAPSITATLPRDRLRGLVLAAGSPTAHASILARAYGIPAVVAVPGLLVALAEAQAAAAADAAAGPVVVAIDGDSGEVVIGPEPATVARYEARQAGARVAAARDRAESALPATTRDGWEVTLLANIGSPAEAAAAVELGARGVGLFRTEFLFMERSAEPGEDEQVQAYREAVRPFGPDPVTIRLLDAGADKPIPYLGLGMEANPFLGVRGLRVAARRPDVFLRQLRAVLRVAAGEPAAIRVMAPMVADLADARLAIELLDRARQTLDAEGVVRGDVELGVMLEVPSAILAADTFFGRVAFASLGTNDLLQYALAVDRGNPDLGRYQDPLHPALLRLVQLSVEAARRAGIDLSVCGEMAGDPAGALALVGLGIGSLSMASSSLPAVRRAIRVASRDVLEAAARDALGDASAEAVRDRFRALVEPA